MKATKKILSLVLALMMVLSSVAVLAETTPCTTHAKSELRDETKATCTEEGSNTWYCNVCDTEWVETVKATDHKWKLDSTTPATCIADAVEHYVCEYDSTHKKDEVKKGTALGEKNHNFQLVEDTKASKPATCKDPGLSVGAYYCANCKTYKDSYSNTIDPVKHEWEKFFTGLTKDADGNEWCTGAAPATTVDQTGSTVTTVTKDATCTENGSVTATCAVCGVSVTKAIKALGHVSEKYATKGDTKDATCTDAGYTVYTCTRTGCNYSWKVEVLPTGHDFTVSTNWSYTQNGKSTTQPGACSDYVITKTCANGCKTTETETVKADKAAEKAAHTLDKMKLIYVDKAATCLEDGIGIYRCQACGYTCSGKIKAEGKHSEKLVKLVKAPTCTEDGEKTMGCNKCDATWTVKLPAVGHKWGTAQKFDGSCTQKAYTKKTCTVCKKEEKTEGDFVHPVTKVTVVYTKLPTCTEDGYQDIKCAECGKTDRLTVKTVNGVSLKKADAHTYTKANGDKNMTVLQKGNVCLVDKIEAPKCVKCGYVDEEHKVVTKAPGKHADVADFDKVVVTVATCKDGGKDGLVRYICPTCKESVEVTVPAPQHVWKVTESKTEKGSYVLTCNTCGETKEIEETKPVVKVDSSKLSSDNYVTLTGVDARDVADGLWIRVTWSYKLANGDSVAFVQACRAEMENGKVIVEIVDPQIDGTLEFRSAYVTKTSRSASKRVASITKLASVKDLK